MIHIIIVLCISKVFEKHICNQLQEFFNKTNILHSTQSGHSCQTALLHLVNKWATNIDKGNMVGNLFLDLRKGFDFVNHDLLLKKLAVYHFWQHSIDLFQSNLRNRKQLVHIDFFSVRLLSDLGVFSHPRNNGQWPPTSKDFYRRYYIYKWSATLYTSDISVSNLETILQKDLNHGLEWWYINKMNLNAPTTRCMLIGSSRKLSKSRDLHLTIGDYQIVLI